MVNERGIVSCLEAATGRLVWQQRLDAEFSGSPLYAGGTLYFFSQEGKCFVMAPGRVAKVLAINTLADGCMASPAVADRALLCAPKPICIVSNSRGALECGHSFPLWFGRLTQSGKECPHSKGR